MLALKASVEGGAEIKKPGVARTPSPAKTGGRQPTAQRTLVFDEIDIGIGGSAAEAVGRKLKTLAARNQVLCVTHLAQIATFADHHYVIEKKQSQGRARTTIRLLTAAERTEEVARMLSGAQLTEASRKHAQQMIKTNA
jgi:DNA repair protein RecN (Recombination protein N)